MPMGGGCVARSSSLGNGRRVQNVKLQTTQRGIEWLYIYVYFSMGIRMPGNSYNTFSILICTYAESKQSADNDFRLLFGVPLMTSSRKRFVRLFAAFACPFLVIAVLLPISADTIKN